MCTDSGVCVPNVRQAGGSGERWRTLWRLMHDMHAPSSPPHVDVLFSDLARRQHGVVARAQLQRLGLGRGAIAHRIRSGRLHRLHPGVYAVGHHILTREGRYLAATLAVGEDAVISHRSAAALWGLLDSATAKIEVSCPRRCEPSRSLTVHRTRTLRPADRAAVDAIPVTTVARTLLDLAEVAPARHVERALDRAEVRRLFDRVAIDDVLVHAAGRHGASVLRAALEAQHGGPTLTRSGLEEAFLGLVRRAGLPRPQLNARVCGFEVDAYWPDSGVVVELDGFAYHRTRRAFEADRRRDIALQAAGLRTARFTDRRLARDPQGVLEDLRNLAVDSPPPRSS
jgi:very-short-patch-repair endonuclease